jgi:hypothetical protein
MEPASRIELLERRLRRVHFGFEFFFILEEGATYHVAKAFPPGTRHVHIQCIPELLCFVWYVWNPAWEIVAEGQVIPEQLFGIGRVLETIEDGLPGITQPLVLP